MGPSDSTYNEFVATLPQDQCRYGVFDYAYMNADTGQVINKLVFVSWWVMTGVIVCVRGKSIPRGRMLIAFSHILRFVIVKGS